MPRGKAKTPEQKLRDAADEYVTAYDSFTEQPTGRTERTATNRLEKLVNAAADVAEAHAAELERQDAAV